MSWPGFGAKRMPLCRCFFPRKSPVVEALEMGLESLESRTMLAGTVQLSVDDGQLFIEGDNEDNSILIDVTAAQLSVSGTNGTTVIDGTGASGYNGISIRMNGGADEVVIEDVRIPGDVVVDGGSGANSIQIEDSIFLSSLAVKNGKSNVVSSTFSHGHVTSIEDNLIQGDLNITNGSSKINVETGSAVAIRTEVINNNIFGSVSIANATSKAKGESEAIGVLNKVSRNNIDGGLEITNAAVRASDGAITEAVNSHVYQNSLIGGDLVIASSNSRASSPDVAGSFVRAHQVRVQDNAEISGNLTITARNSTSKGDSFSSASSVSVALNTLIGGDVNVVVGNGSSSATNGNASSIGTHVDYGSIEGDLSIQHGSARANGTSATGNSINASGINVGGTIATSTRASSATGDIIARGSRVYVSDVDVAGGIAISNGSSKASGGSIYAIANEVYVSLFDNVIDSGITITNGNAKTVSDGGAIGNIAKIYTTRSATADVGITNGRARASGEYSYGSQTDVSLNGLSLSGNIDITQGPANAISSSATGRSTISNDVVVESRTLGNVMIDNGKGVATGFDESIGIRTRYSGRISGGGNLNIHNRAGQATAKGANEAAYGILTEIDDSSDFGGDLRGNVEVSDGTAKATAATPGLSQDSLLRLEATTIEGTLKFTGGKGENLLELDCVSIDGEVIVSTGNSNDWFSVSDSSFGSSLTYDGGSQNDGFDNIIGNSFAVFPPTFISVETV